MTQKIEIGVQANTGGAETGVRKVDDAAQSAAGSVSEIATAAVEAGAGLDRLADKADRLSDTAKRASESTVNQARYTAQRIAEIQKQLSDVLGRSVSFSDARSAALNFEMDRAKGRFKTRQVVNARDYAEYLETSGTAVQIDPRRRAYRNEVVSSSMRGTRVAAEGGARPPERPGEPAGGGDMVDRGKSMAMGFGKSMLALAGITSIMGMAGQAVDMANEESIGLDTLKRRSGDLGVSFDKLQDNVRGATEGLGLTYVESVRLAQQYAKTAGTFGSGTSLRASYGFSRAFGLDPSQGVDFFATMQRIKAVGGDEQSQRRLALMVGEAVSKSGYGGKADELLAAVSNFAQEITRQTLTTPNLGDIAGYLTTLTKTGYPGLDPQNGMAMIGSADQAVRRGGGMGDASMNFLYAALAKGSPGISVYDTAALMQGGLFATTRSTFGKGTPLGGLYGDDHPALNDTTNLQKIMESFDRYYGGNKRLKVDALKNTLQLSSYDQAAAFYEMYRRGPDGLNASGKLLNAAGIDPSKLSATGIYGVGKVASANSAGDLRSIFQDVMARKDLTDSDKKDLAKVFEGSNVDAMRMALTKVIATHDQEKTPGSETRDSIAELKNELTRVGSALQDILNPIRVGIEAMAQVLAPQAYKQAKQDEKDSRTDYSWWSNHVGGDLNVRSQAFRKAQSAQAYDVITKGGKDVGVDGIVGKLPFTQAGTTGYANVMDQRHFLSGFIGARKLKVSDDQRRAMLAAAGGDKGIASDLENILRWENRGQGVAHDLTSSKGAQGYFQMLPSTFAQMGTGGDIHNFSDEARAAAEYLRRARKKFGKNSALVGAAYDGGMGKADWISKGGVTHNAEINDYMAGFSALGSTPFPDGGPSKAPDKNQTVTVTVSGEAMIDLKDRQGNPVGTAALKPFVSSAPSGGRAPVLGGLP